MNKLLEQSSTYDPSIKCCSRFGDYLYRIYLNELDVKDITATQKSASYLDLQLEIDNGGILKTKLYDKRDDFNFPIINFLFISINIPASSAYEVYISQLIRYSRTGAHYYDFWTELSCWRKCFSNKVALHLGWSHRYKHSPVVITIWLTVAKYPYLYHCQDFWRTWMYIWVTRWVSYKKQQLLFVLFVFGSTASAV